MKLPTRAAIVAASLSLLCAARAIASTVQVTLMNPVLAAGEKNTTFLKVGLTGERSAAGRAPVNLALVIDRSGSMSGGKMEQAKEAAIAALDMLGIEDIVSVVAYDSVVEVLVPATKMRDRQAMVAAIRALQPRGSTALFGGVAKGAEELRKFLAPNRVNRVILLSDGLANVGPQRPTDLAELGAALRKEGIAVTTLGLGLDYNEDLMSELARRSDGNHSFVEEATDLVAYFRSELGDVLSVVAQDVTVVIRCAPGVRPVRLIGREGEIVGSVVTAALNQLYGEQEKYLLLELEVAAGTSGQARDIAAVSASYLALPSGLKRTLSSTASVRFSASKEEVAAKVDRGVAVNSTLLIASERNKAALALRDDGRVEDARSLLKENQAYLVENAGRYESKELLSYGSSQSADAEGLDAAKWASTRKGMRDKQFKNEQQQKSAPSPP